MPKTTCPAGDRLSAYLLGKLPGAEARRIFEHLEQCPECEVTIADLEAVAEGDTLLSCLRRPAPADQYEAEPECRADVAAALEGFTGGCDLPGLLNVARQKADSATETRQSLALTGGLGSLRRETKDKWLA